MATVCVCVCVVHGSLFGSFVRVYYYDDDDDRHSDFFSGFSLSPSLSAVVFDFGISVFHSITKQNKKICSIQFSSLCLN